MDLTAETTVVDGTTLVSIRIENPHEQAVRFRVESALDGPIWPPRRRGYPESGWDETGYEGQLAAGDRLALGYATPAPPAPEPVTLVRADPADEPAAKPTTRGTARSFRDPRPPRSVLGPPSVGSPSTVAEEEP